MRRPLWIAAVVAVYLFLLSAAPISAAENQTMGLGLSAGLVGGMGFSFRCLPESGMGIQATTIGWRAGGDSYFNFALEPLYVLRNSGNTAFYVAVGGSMTSTESSSNVAVGAGFGFGWHPIENTWTSFDLLITGYKGDILPYPQCAVHYMLW